MKRLLLALTCVASLPALVFTRQGVTPITVHPDPTLVTAGYTQLAAYTSPTQYVPFDDQCHWLQQDTHLLMHQHIAITGPVYGELSAPFTVIFTLKMYQMSGTFQFMYGNAVTSYVFDGPASYTNYNASTGVMTTVSSFPSGTGTATPPYVQGGPNAGDLITQSGHMVIDPRVDLGWGPWPAHGWALPRETVRDQLTDGTVLDTSGMWSFYSTVDPTQPETPPNGENGIFVGAHCNNQPQSGSSLGEVVSGPTTEWPLLPFSAPVPIHYASYTYGSSYAGEVAPGFTDFRKDANFHMGIPGTQFFQFLSETPQPVTGNVDPFPSDGIGFGFTPEPPFLLDPAVLGSGAHTILTRWETPTGATCVLQPDPLGELCSGNTAHFPGGEEAWALTNFPVTVGPGVPPPPPPPPNPCVTTPLTITSSGLLAAIQAFVNETIAALTLNVTDTRGCTATSGS